MIPLKQILLICAVVALVGCHAGNKGAEEAKLAAKAKAIAEARAAVESKRQSTIVEIANPIVEKAIREQLKKPTGELTKADLEEVTYLSLKNNQLTEVPKGLEKCAKLKKLILFNNRLTDVSALANLTQLEWLFLDRNQLTDAACAGLKPDKVITLCAWIKPERVGKGKSGWQQIYKKQA